MNAVDGRTRGDLYRSIVLAYNTEVMARQKRLKSIDRYLPRKKSDPEEGARKVLAMFKRLAAKQGET